MSTETNNLFIKASRKKLRITTNKGPLSVEDLWDLSLPSLDTIAVQLDDAVQKKGRKSFIGTQPREAEELQLQFDLVKYVIDTKLAEAEAAKTETDRRAQIAFLESLRDKKRIQALEELSEEEISRRLAELGVAKG